METKDCKLTVLEEPAVETLKHRENAPSRFLPVMKYVVAGFICLVVLACTVFSKIFVISVAERLSLKETGKENARFFIMLVIILMVPQAFSFARATLNSFRLKNRPWPTKKAIIAVLIGNVLEVAGLCLFTFVTLSSSTHIMGSESVAVMNCISIVPILMQAFKREAANPPSIKSRIIFGICTVMQFAAFFVVIFLPSFEKNNLSIFSLILISVAWTSNMRKWQMEPRLSPEEQPSPIDEDDLDNSVHPGEVLHRKTATTKATMIAEGLKLLLTPFVSFLVAFCFGLFKPGDLHDGFVAFGNTHDKTFSFFLSNIFLSFFGYFFSYVACSMATQKIAFALPLTLATPISFVLLSIYPVCKVFTVKNVDSHNHLEIAIPLAICVWMTQLLSTISYVWSSQDFIMAKEGQLFWVPSYNAVLLEQNLLLNRKNQLTDDYVVNHNKLAKDSCVFICTTMYHETACEMEQLLISLHRVDCARAISKRRIESHIWFDGAVKRDVLNSFVLQLISLVSKTMKVEVWACNKLETPYGMELRWRLPGGMNFHIHLKDNIKVKNKKRWSQVMYMSYVLDFKTKELNVREEDTYILTTDADINFTVDSVEALLDLMMRDPKVGAVCGRTHPLGDGPLVWYQIFDYAIGHWFQKVANHVLGSVLCCPGCFSVYRAKALRDVLPLYATNAENGVDFLTKDMGEDRWLCTLMVQAGWRLEYCAAAENRTYCPDNFNEFYNQRRRWVPSTLANLGQLIGDWQMTVKSNDSMSHLFMLYQFANVVSTLIGPATVILIIVGGLQYGWETDPFLALVLLLLTSFFYGFICLFTSQKFQLKTAKVLTLIFSLLMGAVVVGLAEQMAENPHNDENPTTPTITTLRPTKKPTKPTTKAFYNGAFETTKFNTDDFHYYLRSDVDGLLKEKRPSYFVDKSNSSSSGNSRSTQFLLGFAVTTWYFFGIVGIFLITAFFHPGERTCLIHGVWYLLCLPSGYLFLMIYSVCNITDRSWGTREIKSATDSGEPLFKMITDKLAWLFRGCKDPVHKEPEVGPINDATENSVTSSVSESDDQSPEEEQDTNVPVPPVSEIEKDEDLPPLLPKRGTIMPKSALKKRGKGPRSPGVGGGEFRFPGEKRHTVRFHSKFPKAKTHEPVSEWLKKKMKMYIPNFEQNGYDDTSFLTFMNEKDLEDIGIEKQGHRRNILNEMEQLNWELDNNVPDNVQEWLEELGLGQYWTDFTNNSYTTPRHLEGLKVMNKNDLERVLQYDLNVVKKGHFKKLVYAITKLQYPTAIERKIREARVEINKVHTRPLEKDGEGIEFEFWTELRKARLIPESKAFGQQSQLSDKLAELRDSALLALTVSNLLWIILIYSLTNKTDLKVIGVNPLGLSFLVVFGIILVVQFLTMFWHRVSTFCHVVARASFKVGDTSNQVWSFDDNKLQPAPSEDELREVRKRRIRKTVSRESLKDRKDSETTPLLNGGASYSGHGGRQTPCNQPV